jgi:hypothetical protein
MATTITQSFSTLKSNLEITGLQKETVSTRQQGVRGAVESRLKVLDSFLTGSYSRSTMIAPLAEADIDIFIVLDPEYYQPNGQASLLDRVKRVLRETYPRTLDISRNGQAVTIQFSDFMVDVVPAFHRKDGGYLIPNSHGGTWIGTDPKKHVEISSSANAAHNGDLVPLIKMIKCWNRAIDRHFRSFHLEVLAWQILEGVRISDYPSGVRYFFDKGKDLISQKNPDPTGYNDDVGYYINTGDKIKDAVSRFKTAHSRALRAEDFARRGLITDAINEWRKVFGNSFPAYG